MRLFVYSVAIVSLGLVGCKPMSDLGEEGSVSGLYAIGVSEGQALTGELALAELNAYCGESAIDTYVGQIARRFSFNAGYKEHPNAGYDADIVKRVGNDGKEGYYLGQGQMFDGAGNLAMMPGKGKIEDIVRGTCDVIRQSLGGGSSVVSKGNPYGTCAYPQISVSKGGNVNGTSAQGSISGSGCTIVKMANAEFKHAYDVAFCQTAMAANFDTSGSGAAGEMSFIIKGN